MYRQFDFEGDVHSTLSCVPLSVRRKLDLAQWKISLKGWQALTRAERMALCHLPVEGSGALEAYAEVLKGFAERAGISLTPLDEPGLVARPWMSPEAPERARALLGDLQWTALDEDARYALWKLSDPKRTTEKLELLTRELAAGSR